MIIQKTFSPPMTDDWRSGANRHGCSLYLPQLSGISGQQSVHSRRMNIRITTNGTERFYA
jgi:hypothetical protein